MLFLSGLISLIFGLGIGKYIWKKSYEDSYKIRIWAISYLVVGVLLISMSFYCRIKPGEVGVVVDLFGSDKGVENKEITLGIHSIPPWKDVYKFPIFEQNHQWVNEDGFNFQTSEGLSVHADIGITFNLESNKVHELFCKYRRGMDEITHLFIKNTIRDAMNKVASRMKIEDLYGPKKEEFFQEVHQVVSKELLPIGFNISRIFIIGKFGVPDLVMEALNKKIEATQRAQQRENELRESEAQAKKEVAIAEGASKSKLISAKAEAEANEMIAKSLTKELLKWQSLTKWDGKLPNAMGGEGVSFLFDVKNSKD
jgi:regulator of protease activity HflC (stomatin/prohibitin superfamily)